MKKINFLTLCILVFCSFQIFAGGWGFYIKYAHNYNADSAVYTYNFISTSYGGDTIIIGVNETLLIDAMLVPEGGPPPPISAVAWTIDSVSFSPSYFQSNGDHHYLTITSPGVYEADVANGTGAYRKFTVVQSASNGISSLDTQEPVLTIYPNPSTGQFNFSGLEKENTIEIYDATGRLVLETVSKNNSERIDLIGKDKGIYFYKITNSNKIAQQGKLILQ